MAAGRSILALGALLAGLSAVPAGQQARRARRRSCEDTRRAPRSRALQSHDQGADAVRRSAARHRSQSGGRGLDRGSSSRATAAPLSRLAYVSTAPAPPARTAGRRSTRSRDRERRDPHRSGRLALLWRHAADRCEQRSRRRNPTSRCAPSTCRRRVPGPREQVYCTKVGATTPEEMYIVGAHMDGIGWGEAANDNAIRDRARHGARADPQQP